MAPDIALAGSAREWPDRLHRFVLDHGGGRVVGRVLSADQVDDINAQVLLIDDVCSFLTPHLVRNLKLAGIEVVGVFAPEDGSHAKRRLLECGISDVIEADASPEEFLKKIGTALAHREIVADDARSDSQVFLVGVTGASTGVGMTEVAVGLALALSQRREVCLLDLDQTWPSVAQRLGLPLHPNIRTVLDSVLHESRRPEAGVLEYDRLHVIGGRSDLERGSLIGKADVMSLMDWLSGMVKVAVADLGPLSQVPPGLVRELNAIVVVGACDPVGVGRLAQVVGTLESTDQSVVAVVNGVRRGSFQRSEVLSELGRSHPTLPVLTLPQDRAVSDAAWNGSAVRRGSFDRGLQSMANLIEQVVK